MNDIKTIFADNLWVPITGLLTLLLVIFWFIDKKERKRLHGFYYQGKRFKTYKILYSFFVGSRIDKNTKKASEYVHREIENKIIKYINKGNSIVILGTPLSGKTRTLVECLKKIKGSDCAIAMPSKFEGEIRFPHRRGFCKKHFLVLDDLHDFFKNSNNASRLIDVANQRGFIIVATCRSSGEWQTVKNSYDTISKLFEVIEIPIPTDKEVIQIIRANNIQEVPKFYDKINIGTLIIDLDTMRDRYNRATNEQKKVLLCIKELYAMGITNEKNEVESVKIKILAEKAHDLILSHDKLNEEIQWIIDNDFGTVKNYGIRPETVYLNQIIEPTYTSIRIVESGIKAFKIDQINFSWLLYTSQNAKVAWDVLNLMKARKINRSITDYNWLIAKQSNYSEAYQVYKTLIEDKISPNKQTFFTLIELLPKGNIKNNKDIDILKHARRVFDEAIYKGHKDIDLFFYNGIVLAQLARALGNDEALFREACDKYAQGTILNPNDYMAFYNWGVVLTNLGVIKNKEEKLLVEACKKYKHCIKIKPDKYEAYYNLGITLLLLSIVRKSDKSLISEGTANLEKAHFLRPDLIDENFDIIDDEILSIPQT